MRCCSILILLLSCFFWLPESVAQPGGAKGKAILKGTVTDEKGTPIDSVTVRFMSSQRGVSFDVKTDGSGKWSVAGIAGGAWDIDFIKDGYQMVKIATTASENRMNKPIELKMQKLVAAPVEQKVPGLELLKEGNALREKKDYSGAIAKYEAVLQANPSLHATYGEIGRTYVEMDQLDKALEAFNKLIAQDPANLEARADAAVVLLKKKDVAAAKTMVAGLDLKGFTNTELLYNLGAEFYNTGQNAEAIRFWEKTATLDPKDVDTHLQLGFAYFAQSEMDKARLEFQKVIELDPNSDNAKAAREILDTMK